MNEGRPYLQIWRGVWVSFCKIAIASFIFVGYKLDGLYCRMAGTPSSPTLFFKRKKKVEKRVESREVEININYKINITVEKGVEINTKHKINITVENRVEIAG